MMALPKPTNRDSKRMLQRMCNRLALRPVQVARGTHSCIFCGQPINPGDTYRNAGYAAASHEDCFHAVAFRSLVVETANGLRGAR
jgi:hypothetical protein